MVTTLYDAPLPWAWFMYQSRRASSPARRASASIRRGRRPRTRLPSRPTTSCTSWTNNITATALGGAGTRPRCGGAGSPTGRAVRVRRASTCPGARISAGMSLVRSPSRRSGSRMRCISTTSRFTCEPNAGWKPGLDLEEARRARVAVLQRRGVDGARGVDVVEELALVGPHRVLHVHRPVRARRRPWPPSQVDVGHRRPRQWHEHLAVDVVAEGVELAHPVLQVAGLDAPGQSLPRRAVAHRGDGDDPVRPAAAVGEVEVPEQSGVVAGREAWASNRRGTRPRRRPRGSRRRGGSRGGRARRHPRGSRSRQAPRRCSPGVAAHDRADRDVVLRVEAGPGPAPAASRCSASSRQAASASADAKVTRARRSPSVGGEHP